MDRLKLQVPAGERILWRSPKTVRPWRCEGAVVLIFILLEVVLRWRMAVAGSDLPGGIPVTLLSLVLAFGAYCLLASSKTEAAVTERHVVWSHYASVLGRLFGTKHRGVVRLADIESVDVEAWTEVVTLNTAEGRSRIEFVAGGDVEAMASAIGLPTRIWRRCESAAASRARRSVKLAGFAGLAFWLAILAVAWTIGETIFSGISTWGSGTKLMAMVGIGLAGQWAHRAAVSTLPHLIGGRRLAGRDRTEFACALTDPAYDGLDPENAAFFRRPPSRLQRWALKKAYGGTPACPTLVPEEIAPIKGSGNRR